MPDVVKILLFGLMLVVWFLLHWYLYRRLTTSFDLSRRARNLVALCLTYFSTAYVIGRAAGRAGDTWVSHGIIVSGAVWMGFLGVFLISLVPVDVFLYVPAWIGWKRRAVSYGVFRGIRKFSLVLCVCVSIVLSVIGMSNAYGPIAVTPLEVVVAGLPVSMDGYTVVFLSDLHVGGLVNDGEVDRIEEVVKSCKADLVILGGDLTDEEGGGDGSMFRRFASWARPGQVVAVSGNHEKYVGGAEVSNVAQASGIRVLRQQSVKVGDGLWVAGVDDPSFFGRGTGFRGPIEVALSSVPAGSPAILVSHQPVGVEDVAARKVSLMLSGHTHHGQMPPFTFLAPMAYRYFAGTYDVDGLVVYVTSGAAFWGPPLRIGTYPEVVRITLKSPGKLSHQQN